MRFYESLMFQLRNSARHPESDILSTFQFNWLVHALENDNCKRLIFDARQAKVFDESEEVDERRKDKIFPPFTFFYLELTEPILLKAQEPGHSDSLFGMLYRQNVDTATEVVDKGASRRQVPITKCTFFYQEQHGKHVQYLDRTWSMSPEGYPLVGRAPKHITQRYKTPVGEGATAAGLVDPKLLPDYVQEGELVNVYELQKLGWWEEALLSNTNLLYWIFAYTMAKSVKIVELPVTRQIRRALEREGRIPNPWHVVRVEPKRVAGKPEFVGESGIHHSYRYDVIGHLRFNKHMTKEGYRDTIEWVSDHQRGLENELYVPKTYKVEKNKEIAVKEMTEYFNGPAPDVV